MGLWRADAASGVLFKSKFLQVSRCVNTRLVCICISAHENVPKCTSICMRRYLRRSSLREHSQGNMCVSVSIRRFSMSPQFFFKTLQSLVIVIRGKASTHSYQCRSGPSYPVGPVSMPESPHTGFLGASNSVECSLLCLSGLQAPSSCRD